MSKLRTFKTTVGGRDYELRCTLLELDKLETLRGKPFTDVLAEFKANKAFRVREAAEMFFVSAQGDDLPTVDEFLASCGDAEETAKMGDSIVQAINLHFPAAEDGEAAGTADDRPPEVKP